MGVREIVERAQNDRLEHPIASHGLRPARERASARRHTASRRARKSSHGTTPSIFKSGWKTGIPVPKIGPINHGYQQIVNPDDKKKNF